MNKSYTSKKLLIGVSTLVVIGLLIGGGFFYKNRDNGMPTPSDGKDAIKYAPATEEEKAQAEANKDRIVEEYKNSKNSASAPGNKKSVTPTITNTSGSTINAYISGIFEEGGTCTAVFTKGSTKVTKTTAGFANVSYTQCTPIRLEPGFLSSGSWSVTVSYSSSTAEGTSSVKTIEVD